MKPPRLLENASSLMRILGSGPGILLLHGFRGTPAEMKYLGDRCLDHGFSIYIPRLPGHGTTLYDMLRTGFRDWHLAAREAYIELSSMCDPVFVAGLSMGGILTVHLAAEFEIGKIALMSVPRTFKEKSIYAAPIVSHFMKILRQEDLIKGVLDEEARSRHVCYHEGIPVRQAWEVFRAAGRAMRLLPQVKSDAIIIQSRLDDAIPADSLDRIYDRLGSVKKKAVWLDQSGHAVTVDYERDRVAKLVIDFFSEG